MTTPPPGYRIVTVELSEREYNRICTPHRLELWGTESAALRKHFGMLERPKGINAAEKRQREEHG